MVLPKYHKNQNQKGYFISSITGGRTMDMNLALPIRQTASIFKQPVTVIRNRKSQVKSAPLNKSSGPLTELSQPRQVF